MTPEASRALLAEAAAEVLEKMFFTELMDEAPPPETLAGDWITARVRFRGSPPGACRVAVGEGGAAAIASNFLGLEPDQLTPERVRSVIGELANMICGSLLSRLEARCRFSLASPEIRAGGLEILEAPGRMHWFEFEGSFLGASLEMEPET